MRRLAMLSLGLLACSSLPCSSRAQDDSFGQVEASELAANPQKYWATGVVFKDILVEGPAGGVREFNKRDYVRFKTKVLGVCYAEALLQPALADIKPGREVILSGTVLQESSGFFGSKPKYVYLVTKITSAMQDLDALPERLEAALSSAGNAVDRATIQVVARMVADIQGDMQAYAVNQKVELWELFVPESKHREQLTWLVRNGLQKVADENKVTPADLFSNYVISMLSIRNPPPGAPKVESAARPEAGSQPEEKADDEELSGEEKTAEDAPAVDAKSAGSGDASVTEVQTGAKAEKPAPAKDEKPKEKAKKEKEPRKKKEAKPEPEELPVLGLRLKAPGLSTVKPAQEVVAPATKAVVDEPLEDEFADELEEAPVVVSEVPPAAPAPVEESKPDVVETPVLAAEVMAPVADPEPAPVVLEMPADDVAAPVVEPVVQEAEIPVVAETNAVPAASPAPETPSVLDEAVPLR